MTKEEFEKILIDKAGFDINNIEECKKALEKDGMNIAVIHNQTEELQTIAVMQNPKALEFCKTPSDTVCMVAINKDPESLRFIPRASSRLSGEALAKDGLTLRFVKHQTTILCKMALAQNPDALKYIIDPKNVPDNYKE